MFHCFIQPILLTVGAPIAPIWKPQSLSPPICLHPSVHPSPTGPPDAVSRGECLSAETIEAGGKSHTAFVFIKPHATLGPPGNWTLGGAGPIGQAQG